MWMALCSLQRDAVTSIRSLQPTVLTTNRLRWYLPGKNTISQSPTFQKRWKLLPAEVAISNSIANSRDMAGTSGV